MAHEGRKNARFKLASLIATGMPVKYAAKEAGLSRSTAARWVKIPAFVGMVDRLKNRAVSEAVANLSSSMSKAATKLGALVDSADEKISLAAAKSLLEMALKARREEETDRKIAELTERINKLTSSDKPDEPGEAQAA